MDVYTVNMGGQYHDEVSIGVLRFGIGRCQRTPPVLVLHPAWHQSCFQALRQSCRDAVQELTRHLRVAGISLTVKHLCLVTKCLLAWQ